MRWGGMCKDLDRLCRGQVMDTHRLSVIALWDIGRNNDIEITATHIFVFALIQAVLKI